MNSLRNNPGNVWVISDTHLKSKHILPHIFLKKVERGDIVIHLGDFVAPEIVEQLEERARLFAVYGNCDPPSLRDRFRSSDIITLNGHRIGLTHGRGDITETVNAVRGEFEGKVDIALFGHLHKRFELKTGKTLFINPGSLSQSRQGPESFGRLHLDHEPWFETFDL